MELVLRIIGENLAKVDFGKFRVGEAGTLHSRFFLGIQKGQEVVDIIPITAGDASDAAFTALFSVSPLPDGATNFLGPYAHGSRTARFCYLCWLTEGENGTKNTVSRIKLPLTSRLWARVETAACAGKPLVMRFSLLGKGGGPVCASIPENTIQWEG